MPGHDIIVVGASAGGVEALVSLVRGLPPDLPAAVFVVLHIPAQSPSLLPDILSRVGLLAAVHPEDNREIKHGRIYVAPPDQHMLIERGYVRVVLGPKENRHRPAIDPLFRSAARAYGPRVIGVVLTGALDDGTAGLLAVKRRGGVTVVQDPHEAMYPSMPQSALDHVEVDYMLPRADIAALLARLAYEEAADDGAYSISQDMDNEVRIAEMDMTNIRNDDQHVGTPSAYSCPECGGVLWEIHDGALLRFRCRVGHAFSVDAMLAEQSNALEEALWTALKTLGESASLSRRLLEQAHERGQVWLAKRFEEKLQEAEQRIVLIQRAFQKSETPITTDEGGHRNT